MNKMQQMQRTPRIMNTVKDVLFLLLLFSNILQGCFTIIGPI